VIVWAMTAITVVALGRRVAAEPLDRRIPNLFGGSLATSITPRDVVDAQHPSVVERFRGLSAALASAHAQVPSPSTTGAFSFVLVGEYDAFVRVPQSLGPTFAERAQTLGRHIFTIGSSYSHMDFDTLEGDSLRHLVSSQPALSPAFIARLPRSDQLRALDNTLETQLDVRFGLDVLFLSTAMGITDDLDVSATLSLVRAQMRVGANAVIHDPNGDGGVFFSGAQPGVVVGGAGRECSVDFRCATDGFNATATGTGDILLRAKWHAVDLSLADVALAGVLTVPTGNAGNYLGFHDPTVTPWFIASKTFGVVAPHLNIGYALRSGRDVSQAEWIAGCDIRATAWLTLTADALGYHDDHRDGVNDDVLQAALGAKWNPFGNLVLGGSLQLPMNRDGLRADVIYSLQAEQAF
jgi:hypothetical protein